MTSMAAQSKIPRAQGEAASELRRRQRMLPAHLRKLPDHALPGSLSKTHRRCGKPRCRCARGEGHVAWMLTFMADGKKHVEWIPTAWAEEIHRRVAQGHRLQDALREYLEINAKLLVLSRSQRRR
jgi:hypothetical protein